MSQAIPTRHPPSFADLPDDAYIREAALVGGVLPVSRGTLWRWVKDGHFIAPVKLSRQVTAWKVGDVRAWLKAQAAQQA